jgi:hypothetical protein
MHFEVDMNVKYKDDKKGRTYPQTKPFNKIVKGDNFDAHEQNFVENFVNDYINEYSNGIESAEIVAVRRNVHEIQSDSDLKNIKMKDALALPIDGHENQDWDTKQGRCVFDFIIDRFGKRKKFIKVCNYESLNHIFMEYDDIDQKYVYEDALIHGVNCLQIELFCKQFDMCMYALDEDDNTFHTYKP